MLKKFRMGTGNLKHNGAQTETSNNCNNAMFTYLIKADVRKGIFLTHK